MVHVLPIKEFPYYFVDENGNIYSAKHTKLYKLKENNKAGWEQCVAARKYLEKEVELYIH